MKKLIAITPGLRSLAALLWLGLVLLDPAPLRAQAPEGQTLEGLPAATVEELSALVETLQDEGRRAELVTTLRGLMAARGASPEAPTSDALSQTLRGFSQTLGEAGSALVTLGRNYGDPRRIVAWFGAQADDPERRALWLRIVFQLAVMVAAGLVAAGLVRWFLARARRAVEQQSSEAARLWQQAPLLVARTLLDLVPIAAFAGGAFAAIALLEPGERARLVMLAAIYAVVLARGILAVARMLLTPLVPTLRLWTLKDKTAAYLFVWLRRLVNLPVFGYFTAQALLALGLPDGGYTVLVKLVGLGEALLLFVLVSQLKAEVAAAIRGSGEAGGVFSFSNLRRRLADAWHVVAGLYLAALYFVWALEIPGGFAYLLEGTLVSLVIVLATRLVRDLMRRGADRLLRVSPAIRARYPHIESRANRYLPWARNVAAGLVYFVAALLLLDAWEIDVFAWLAGDSGRELLARAVNVIFVLLVSLGIWELASGLITIYLEKRDTEDHEVVRSARARTLLPLARNALLVVIFTLAALTTLSELGVDIGPLLAGAGVVGLAVGFGAQTLVKDIITGAFILFEDAISVGDYVEVGGHSGTIESLTVRTIQLRAPSGTVYTVPFSSVDTITNMTKDYAFHIAEVGVAYREDIEEVMAVLGEVGEELRQDPEFGPHILEPISIDGVDRFDDSAVVIRARLKTEAGQQWRIKRALNRRIKHAFDARGIEIPFPHSTIFMGEDKSGRAQMLRVQNSATEPESES
jgi:small conductance mechanosensitive channel